MEILVDSKQVTTEDRGTHWVYVDLNGNDVNLSTVTLAMEHALYRFTGNNVAFVYEDVRLVGDTNLITQDDEGLEIQSYRIVLQQPTSKRWILVTAAELEDHFDKL